MRPIGVPGGALAAGVLAAFALGACSGPAELSLGSTMAGSTTDVFLSATGSDASAGSREHPWKTFAHALEKVTPGARITLLDGHYDSGSGYLDARCGGNVPAALTGITIAADTPRGAFLVGDGSTPPIRLEGCKGWTIEGLRVKAENTSAASDAPDAGSVIVIGPNNDGVVLRGLLAYEPNAYTHSHVIRIGDGSRGVRVEACELYDFHHNAIEATRTIGTVLVRNYINGRGQPDKPGFFESDDATGGDYGVLLEETRDSLVENNVIEGVHDGFGLVGRDNTAAADALPPAPGPVGNNRLLGNVVFNPQGAGVRLDSRCDGMAPCTQWERQVIETVLKDNVVVGASVGVSSAGAINTQIHQLSVINAANGVFLMKEPQNAGVKSTTFVFDTLVAGFQGVAFKALNEMDWSFVYCAASAPKVDPKYFFEPADTHVSNSVSVPPDLGGCLVFLPPASGLNNAGTGMGPVGANVINRYEDGILGTEPLWDPISGAFPCGTIVDDVNREPPSARPDQLACMNVHKRLHVAPAGTPADANHCPLP